MSKKKKIIILVILITLLTSLISFSTAKFYAIISGNKTSNNVNVNMKDLSISFDDNNPAIDVDNIKPGWTYQKLFSVTNN